jgi:D-tagatose-1,6-bisphosphate aldolase subunit GatZ/KbaZ
MTTLTIPDDARWSGASRIHATVRDNLRGAARGIYSVCCSHELVLEAAVDQALADGTPLLVEATANQVNQFGGYTGMRPADFRDHVHAIAARRGLAETRVILGGDHLGPVCWAREDADIALQKAESLVAGFAAAGFSKIHLDCSMPLGGDPAVLDDATVAARAARLCAVAEAAAVAAFGASGVVYVIGTEVPPPGGADEAIATIEVTPPDRARRTLAVHHAAFRARGLDAAWDRVVALVVQPGVEFDHGAVIDYRPDRARDLSLLDTQGIAFEAHSTDYQRPAALAQLVRDHFSILKVGPALTFALREALFALSHIEAALVPPHRRSHLVAACEAVMKEKPGYWERFYHGGDAEKALLRLYSLSDRIRYYWPDPTIEDSVARLFANLEDKDIPLGLLGQFFPAELAKVRAGTLSPRPREIVKAHVRQALAPYALACGGEA